MEPGTAEQVEQVTKTVVNEAQEMSKLALGVAVDAGRVEASTKEISSEAETVGKNTNTALSEITAVAEFSEKMKTYNKQSNIETNC